MILSFVCLFVCCITSLSSLNPAGSTHTSELKPGQSSTVMIPCQTEVEKLNKKGVRGDKKQRKAA